MRRIVHELHGVKKQVQIRKIDGGMANMPFKRRLIWLSS